MKTTIDSQMTVNEVINRHPETVTVFNEFGIDSCCGGAVVIPVAAERDGADLAALLERLNRTVADENAR